MDKMLSLIHIYEIMCFSGRGILSAWMSFGGGDAYMTDVYKRQYADAAEVAETGDR